jgi:hypothetical protein
MHTVIVMMSVVDSNRGGTVLKNTVHDLIKLGLCFAFLVLMAKINTNLAQQALTMVSGLVGGYAMGRSVGPPCNG